MNSQSHIRMLHDVLQIFKGMGGGSCVMLLGMTHRVSLCGDPLCRSGSIKCAKNVRRVRYFTPIVRSNPSSHLDTHVYTYQIFIVFGLPQDFFPSGHGPLTQEGPALANMVGATCLHSSNIWFARSRISHWDFSQHLREYI